MLPEHANEYLIYSKNHCPYCRNIKKVLEGIGEDYMELKLDTDFSREQFTEKFGYGATFPRVLKDGKLIGGCNEAVVHLRNQGLI